MSYYTKKREKVKKNFSLKSFLIYSVSFLAIIAIFTTLFFVVRNSLKIKPDILQNKFTTEFNNMNESYKFMQKKGFNISESEKNYSFAKKFAGFFKLESVCDDYSDACLWNNLTYKTLDGEIIPIYYGAPNVGQFRTQSGALYMLYSYDNDLWIFIDTNGIMQKPNRFGLDLFAFYIGYDNELRIMGSANTPYQNINLYCNPYTSNKYNGLSCPYKAAMDSDYFANTIKILY